MSVTSKTGRAFFRGEKRLAVALALLITAGSASALPPEHEVRRLMLATETAVQNGEWREAGEYLNRLQALDVDKPYDYQYFRGRVMLEAGQLNEARQALEQYVSSAGNDGDHYDEALELITDVENAQRRSSTMPEPGQQAERVAIIEPADGQSLASLRRLYLANSNTEALAAHLNSQISANGWRADHRVVRSGTPADIEYRVSSGPGEVHIQESRLMVSGERQVSAEPLPVFGVSPLVRWDCDGGLNTCWIYDPRDGSRLMQLGANRELAREAARTLGRLIKELQNPG